LIKRNLITAIVLSVSLVSYTAYVLLDTFAIPRVYKVVENTSSINYRSDSEDKEQTSESTQKVYMNKVAKKGIGIQSKDSDIKSSKTSKSNSTKSTAQSSDTTYKTDDTSITLSTYREYDTNIYVAEVEFSKNAQIETAFAQNSYGKNVTATTSSMAESSAAILAVNGDYYGARDNGYVIRDGIIYRSSAKADQEDLVIYKDGSMKIINESEVSAQELVDDGAITVLSFGPALVEDGKVSVSQNDEVGKAMASNPRTAIAITEDNHYLFIVSDGRTDESEGLSLYELATFAASLGAKTVYNLDGGGSSTMYFNGNVVNNPTTNGWDISERGVSDIVYISK
jgi:exopolysaccharide biosynthesis protein